MSSKSDLCSIFVRADSRLAPSQWETSLQSNAVSHWLGTNLEAAIFVIALLYAMWQYILHHYTVFWGKWTGVAAKQDILHIELKSCEISFVNITYFWVAQSFRNLTESVVVLLLGSVKKWQNRVTKSILCQNWCPGMIQEAVTYLKPTNK